MTTDTDTLVKVLIAFRAGLAATRSATKASGGQDSVGRVMAYDVAVVMFDARVMPILLALRDQAISAPSPSIEAEIARLQEQEA